MFTESCFLEVPYKWIKGKPLPVNQTPMIVKKLFNLGYKAVQHYEHNETAYGIFCNNGKFKLCSTNERPSKKQKNFYDCKNNLDMFIAIAAIRNDSDENQWFVEDGDNTYWENSPEGPSKYMMMHGHKASAQEIYEHFSKDKEEIKNPSEIVDTVFGTDPYIGTGIKRDNDVYSMYARDNGVEINVNGKLTCYIEIVNGKPSVKLFV